VLKSEDYQRLPPRRSRRDRRRRSRRRVAAERGAWGPALWSRRLEGRPSSSVSVESFFGRLGGFRSSHLDKAEDLGTAGSRSVMRFTEVHFASWVRKPCAEHLPTCCSEIADVEFGLFTVSQYGVTLHKARARLRSGEAVARRDWTMFPNDCSGSIALCQGDRY
jgi:hypothetical protein